MSIFDDDDSPIREIIEFFNVLSDEEKATIVANLHPNSFRPKKYFEKLAPLMSKIQGDLGKFEGIKIGNKLMELGLEETYARLIVSNMKKQVPTISYHVSQVAKLDDKYFDENFEKMCIAMWIDEDTEKSITEKYNISHDQFESIVGITTYMINMLFRGEITEKKVLDLLTGRGLSGIKSHAILRSIQSHKDELYSRFMFSNLQDALGNTVDIKQQNIAVLGGIDQIIRLLKLLITKRGHNEENLI